MKNLTSLIACSVAMALCLSVGTIYAQEAAGNSSADSATSGTMEKVDEIADVAKEKAAELQEQVNDSESAQEVASGILEPIYTLAESFGQFSAFYWIAFAIMATGVVSFALQLVLGKLVALANSGFSLTEILSDGLGLAISVVGLVLTTQAATENSQFAASAFSVLSATVVGIVLGFMFYIWGQRQELEAINARKSAATKE